MNRTLSLAVFTLAGSALVATSATAQQAPGARFAPPAAQAPAARIAPISRPQPGPARPGFQPDRGPRPGGQAHWNRPRGNWNRGGNWQQQGHRWNGGQRWGGQVNGRWYAGHYAPGGWGGYRRPSRGWTLPRYWFAPSFYVSDYAYWGLGAPRSGYTWVRYYDDAVLVDSRGRVDDYVAGVDWDRGYDRDERYDAPEYGADYEYDGYGADYAPPHSSYPGGYAPSVRFAPPAAHVQPIPGQPIEGEPLHDRAGEPRVYHYENRGYSDGYGYAPSSTTTVVVHSPVTTTTTTTTTTSEEVVSSYAPARRTVKRRPRSKVLCNC